MSFRKVLAAVDESPAGADALRAAAQLAAAAEAQLLALRVVEDPWRFIPPGEVETRRALRDGSYAPAARAVVTDELRTLMASLGLATAGAVLCVRFGLAAVEIARCAETEGADLIVLGRWPAGGTIEGTIRRARVPCLVVPSGQRIWSRVLALADDGLDAGDVLRAAFALAEPFGGGVTALHVEPQLTLAHAGAAEAVARKAFAEWARAPGGAAFDVVTREGDLGGEALRTARELEADVLVLGCRRGECMNGAAGSTAARILRRAPCAVLTVPL